MAPDLNPRPSIRRHSRRDEGITAPEVFLAFMFWVIHRCMVATKVGMYTRIFTTISATQLARESANPPSSNPLLSSPRASSVRLAVEGGVTPVLDHNGSAVDDQVAEPGAGAGSGGARLTRFVSPMARSKIRCHTALANRVSLTPSLALACDTSSLQAGYDRTTT